MNLNLDDEILSMVPHDSYLPVGVENFDTQNKMSDLQPAFPRTYSNQHTQKENYAAAPEFGMKGKRDAELAPKFNEAQAD